MSAARYARRFATSPPSSLLPNACAALMPCAHEPAALRVRLGLLEVVVVGFPARILIAELNVTLSRRTALHEHQ